jgi:ABC-type Zn uptake system ZnuABC Zn-binding protein ZnuA
MKNNNMTALRDHLFEVIERVKSNNDPNSSANEKMSVEEAKAISQAAAIIVNSAKIEVDLLKVISAGNNNAEVKRAAEGTQFFQLEANNK